MSVLVISNPAGGDRTAPLFITTHVLPLLAAHSVPYTLKQTEAAGHAGQLAADFLRSRRAGSGSGGHGDDGDGPTIVLGGGDGTLHEVVNALVGSELGHVRVRFVLLPLGTANALYYSFFPPAPSASSAVPAAVAGVLGDTPLEVALKLQSLAAFLVSTTTGSGGGTELSPLKPLTLARTTFTASSSTTVPPPIISAVVTSTSLHAAILDTAEHLRAEFTGTDRFKEAARRNIERWYEAQVRLLPAGGGHVQRYEPAVGAFVDVPRGEETFDEPFAYFLSTVNVDRLEPAFRIAPLARALPSASGSAAPSMDVLLIRPRRDPAFGKDLTGARAAFPGKVMRAMQGAYADGAHVRLRYDESGEVVDGGGGKTLVEYFRCGGWEWEPESMDESAHLVCADGTIIKIPQGGKAVCQVLPAGEGGFYIWA